MAFAKITEAIDAAANFDLLIADAPGSVTRATLDIVRHSHIVVQPTGPSVDDLDPAIMTFHELTQAGIPRERLLIALCRTLNRAEEDDARAYFAQAGYQVLRASIPERAGYRSVQNLGQALTETREQALNARADMLLAELLGRVDAAIAAMSAANNQTRKRNAPSLLGHRTSPGLPPRKVNIRFGDAIGELDHHAVAVADAIIRQHSIKVSHDLGSQAPACSRSVGGPAFWRRDVGVDQCKNDVADAQKCSPPLLTQAGNVAATMEHGNGK